MYDRFSACSVILFFLSLSGAQPLSFSQSLAVVDIQRTLYTFSVAVDTHNFSLLADVFSPDATANFDDSYGELRGIANISAALQAGLEGQKSWHSLSTQLVDFDGPQKAIATSYLQGTFFGQGNLTGQIDTTYGRYHDAMELTKPGWRITRKRLTRTGNIGNAKILA